MHTFASTPISSMALPKYFITVIDGRANATYRFDNGRRHESYGKYRTDIYAHGMIEIRAHIREMDAASVHDTETQSSLT